ncbi:hypothetical protein HWV62_20520 [Athelia sp. TMB]|nr:hypothetical protein HWV62_20520 [Athelia sp. TMB]
MSARELDLALAQLRRLRASMPPADAAQLPQVRPSFTDDPAQPLPDEDALDARSIVRRGILRLHPDAARAIATARTAGVDELWSHAHLVAHLAFLARTTAHTDTAPARTVIDAFFFRAAATVPPPQKIVVLPGNSEYTAVVAADADAAEELLAFPRSLARATPAFLAIAAPAPDLDAHLPRAILALVARTRQLGSRRQTHIRGALTTGRAWRFLAVTLPPSPSPAGAGAGYWVSQRLDAADPALIAGVLSSWPTQRMRPGAVTVCFRKSSGQKVVCGSGDPDGTHGRCPPGLRAAFARRPERVGELTLPLLGCAGRALSWVDRAATGGRGG